MKYNKVNVVKKITFLLMTMALGVAFVACQAATPAKPADPEPGPAGPAGEPASRLPYLTKGFADVNLTATGDMATVTIPLAGYFIDPHEGELTYSASSDPSDVVGTPVSGSTLTLTAMKEGTATVTVKAENKDGASAFNLGAQFNVTVTKTAPPMVDEGRIPDQTLYKDDAPVMLKLTKADADAEEGFFFHTKAITYVVTTLSPAVEVAEENGTLTLTPVLEGQTIVTVVATADSKATDAVTFTVDVMAGSKPIAPVAEGTLESMTLVVGGAPGTVDVTGNFSDPDGEILEYSAESSDSMTASVKVAGSRVTVTAVAAGTATITVTATDEDSLSASQMFKVTVNAPKGPAAPMTKGTIPDMELTVGGEPETVDASDYFTGEMLKYSVVSKAKDIATVKYSKSMVTVTAIAKGSSDITITAMNDGGTATQDFTVEVMASEPKNEPPTKTGIGAKSLRPGETETINLDSYFSDPEGEALSYDVASSAPDKVMATETGGTLTLEAQMVGTATITVEATDDAGNMVSDMFVVTVDMGCPSTIDLDVGEIQKCDLLPGYAIHDPKSGAIVRVQRVPGATANTHSFQGLNPGSVELAVQDTDFTTVDTITVTVRDPKPTRNTKANPPDPSTLALESTIVDGRKIYKLGVALKDAPLPVGATVLNSFFDDNDLSSLNFKAVLPPGILINQDSDGNVKNIDDDSDPATWNFQIEVLNLPGTNTFNIKFFAIDAAGQESEDPVVFTFITGLVPPPTADVRTNGSYDIGQYTSGDFKKTTISIGNRLGVKHRLTFGAVLTANEGFRFAQNRLLELEIDERLPETTGPADRYHLSEVPKVVGVDVDGADVYTKPASTPHANASMNAVVGVDYWEVSDDGAISVEDTPFTLADGMPSNIGPESDTLGLEFTPVRTGPGIITIKYHVWAASGSVTGIDAATLGGKWETVTRTLTVNVQTCSDFEECAKL